LSAARILVVEDERPMLSSIRLILSGHGYEVVEAENGNDALREVSRELPDLVLLDLMLPGMDGLDVCKTIRSSSPVGIVVLSAKGDERTKVAAFDLGADDYLTKPFSSGELLARVKVALRHTSQAAETGLTAGRITIDIDQRRVSVNGQRVPLTPLEYDVLRFLVRNRDRVVTHEAILRAVWGPEYSTETQYVRNVVLALRRKLEVDPSDPQLILTEPGIGYRFQPGA
jgi:two-component system KDP operon response regulator KdpE